MAVVRTEGNVFGYGLVFFTSYGKCGFLPPWPLGFFSLRRKKPEAILKPGFWYHLQKEDGVFILNRDLTVDSGSLTF